MLGLGVNADIPDGGSTSTGQSTIIAGSLTTIYSTFVESIVLTVQHTSLYPYTTVTFTGTDGKLTTSELRISPILGTTIANQSRHGKQCDCSDQQLNSNRGDNFFLGGDNLGGDNDESRYNLFRQRNTHRLIRPCPFYGDIDCHKRNMLEYSTRIVSDHICYDRCSHIDYLRGNFDLSIPNCSLPDNLCSKW